MDARHTIATAWAWRAATLALTRALLQHFVNNASLAGTRASMDQKAVIMAEKLVTVGAPR